MVDGVQVADDHVGEFALAGFDQVVFVEKLFDAVWPFRDSSHDLANALFNALGDFDFAFPRQKFDGAHFAHVHAYRVSCTVLFSFDGCKGGGGFGRCDLVGGTFAAGNQQGVRIGRCFINIDAHVVDHLDDVFNLIRIRNIFGQMVIDLSIGQESLFPAFGDQLFDP